MSDDYGFSERRKNKNDKRAKGKFNRYKLGGKHRSDGLLANSVSNENNRKK